MSEIGYIEIKVENKDNTLSPADIDISEIKEIITDIETFLHPSRTDKISRPRISYKIEDGSVVHKFFTAVTSVIAFSGLIGEIAKRGNIDFLEYNQQKVIASFQETAKKNGYIISLNNSINPDSTLKIDQETSFQITAPSVYEGEFYLYGEIYQEGGKTPNLHIATKEYGNLTVAATKEQIMEGEKKTYRQYGVKVKGKKDINTDALFDLKLIEFIRYNPKFDQEKFNAIMEKASMNLNEIIDTDAHVRFVKGL